MSNITSHPSLYWQPRGMKSYYWALLTILLLSPIPRSPVSCVYIYLPCSHFLRNTGYILNHLGVPESCPIYWVSVGFFLLSKRRIGMWSLMITSPPGSKQNSVCSCDKTEVWFPFFIWRFHRANDWAGKLIYGVHWTNGYEQLFHVLNINSNGKEGFQIVHIYIQLLLRKLVWVCWANKIFVYHCIEPSMQLGINLCQWKGSWTKQRAVL